MTTGWLMASTEGRVAKPERRWGCRRGTPRKLRGTMKSVSVESEF